MHDIVMANELALYNPTDESVVVYQSEDGTLQLDVQLSDETVWLTQQQMAMLFGVKEHNITYHIQGIFKTHELEPEATTQKIRVVRLEGNRKVARSIDFYNLVDTFVWGKPSHDRWLIIDDTLYHCGHSLKDMGQKLSAISLMGTPAQDIIDQIT